MSLVLALLSAAGTGVWLGWYIRAQLEPNDQPALDFPFRQGD